MGTRGLLRLYGLHHCLLVADRTSTKAFYGHVSLFGGPARVGGTLGRRATWVECKCQRNHSPTHVGKPSEPGSCSLWALDYSSQTSPSSKRLMMFQPVHCQATEPLICSKCGVLFRNRLKSQPSIQKSQRNSLLHDKTFHHCFPLKGNSKPIIRNWSFTAPYIIIIYTSPIQPLNRVTIALNLQVGPWPRNSNLRTHDRTCVGYIRFAVVSFMSPCFP